MASRRYRGKNTLNGNIGHVNARLNVVEKMSAPKRLQDGAITTSFLAENAVTSTAIAPGSVGSAAIAEASITAPLLATNAVTGTKILDGAITDGKINSAGISGNKITSGIVDANYIDNLDASKITSGTIDIARLPSTSSAWDDITGKPTSFPPEDHDASKVTTGVFATARIPSITGSMIASNTIEAGNIAPDSVNSSELIDGCVTTQYLDDLAVTHAKLGGSSVFGSLYATTGGSRTNIFSNSIGQGSIGNDAIGAGELINTSTFTMGGLVVTPGDIRVVNPVTTSTTTGACYYQSYAGVDYTIKRFVSASSRRYKRDITPLAFDTEAYLTPQPVTFKYNPGIITSPGQEDNILIGFIAEDFHDAGINDVVVYNDDNEVEELKYDKMVMFLHKIVSDQQATIKTLTERVAALEAK